MWSTHAATVLVAPAALTIDREGDRDRYDVTLHLSPPGPVREWLLVTPRNRAHPGYAADHWLADAAGPLSGDGADLPRALHLSVDAVRLDPGQSHRAMLYVLVWRTAEDLAAQRVPVVVTPARLHATATPTDEGAPWTASPTPASRPFAATPLRPARARRATPPAGPAVPPALERFCGGCGRPYADSEKFCPKDGRKRRVLGGTR